MVTQVNIIELMISLNSKKQKEVRRTVAKIMQTSKQQTLVSRVNLDTVK